MPKEENKKKKKRKLKWQVKFFVLITLIIIYAFFIGTKGIFTKDFKITSKDITSDMHGLKIAHFSDLYFASSVTKNDVKKIVKKINQSNPDIVIFSGNLINKKHKLTSDEKEFLTNELKNIKAEYGKYYVSGIDDFDDASSILNMASFTNLETGQQLVYTSNKNALLLVDKNNAKSYFESENIDVKFKILVVNNPKDFDKLKKYNFDMALAGYTLNGQINIPKLKDLLIDGKHNKTYEKINKTRLYVNPGIGTRIIHARMFNHPTIYLYRLNKTSK